MGFMEKFAKRLRELRLEEGLSTVKLGKAIGVSNTAICRWESCSRVPSILNLIALAQFFKVTTDYLCGLEDD